MSETERPLNATELDRLRRRLRSKVTQRNTLQDEIDRLEKQLWDESDKRNAIAETKRQ